jgi:hypothetical protein
MQQSDWLSIRKQEALTYVSSDLFAWLVISSKFIDDCPFGRIAVEMDVTMHNQLDRWFIVVSDGEKYMLELLFVHEREFELIKIVWRTQLRWCDETDEDILAVDMFHRCFDRFTNELQFFVDTLDLDPFLGPYYMPWYIAVDDVHEINLFEAMDLAYNIST